MNRLSLGMEATELVIYCLDWDVGDEWILVNREFVERTLAEAENEP